MIIEEGTIFQVETRAMLEGFHLACDKEYWKLELERGNGLLVDSILVGGAAESKMTELRQLDNMLICLWEVRV